MWQEQIYLRMQLKRQYFFATDNNYKVDFAVDNILNSKIKEKGYNYIIWSRMLLCTSNWSESENVKEIKRILDEKEKFFAEMF